VVLKGRGIRPGSVETRLELRRSGRRLLLARARSVVRAGRTTRFALRLTRAGRRALGKAEAVRLTLRTTLRRPGGRRVRRVRRLRLTAR